MFLLLKHKLFFFFIAKKESYWSYVFVCKSNGHVADMHATSSSFKMLDSWYHATLWFASGFLHPLLCLVLCWESWLVFLLRQKAGRLVFICKAIVHQLPSSLFSLLTAKSVNSFIFQSLGCIMYKIPPTRSVFSKRAVSCLVMLTTIDEII